MKTPGQVSVKFNIEPVQRAGNAAEYVGQHGLQRLALLGQRQSPRQAAEQWHTQDFLQAFSLAG